jgi:hypothetical protein
VTDTEVGDDGELRRWGLDSPEVPCGRLEIPTAATGDASGVGQSAATLGGSVTPNGRATQYRFAVGPTAQYGASTPAQDAGAGDAAVPASAALTGLAPGTTYHYRIEAIREGGAVAAVGDDRTFTTATAQGDKCVVPKVKGKSLKKAKKALAAANCKLGKVKKPRKARGKLVVKRTKPAAGTELPADSKVAVKLGVKRRK